ncbi:MAG: hypothetical protein U1E46_02910 [Hyphomicrobiales bacterium]
MADTTTTTLPASDRPRDEVRYLECKVILKGERFTSLESFRAFEKIVRRAAKDTGVDYEPNENRPRPSLREVLFMDTEDFRLYRNAFILRRRMEYQHGFRVGDPEIVFKYRHPDHEAAAAVDVTPKISGDHVIKFKAEALPLKDKPGGVRILYSHNSQFLMSQVEAADKTSVEAVTRILPALKSLFPESSGHIQLVNHIAVVEVLQELGTLYFGKGVEAPCNVAVWRTRGDEQQLVGEFSFQCKFKKASDVQQQQRDLARRFFSRLQTLAEDWLALGVTKTGTVYRLNGNPPQGHE